jgi:pSer/pThr/pTyr-binding forkhead associated (FHA) protein
MWVIQLPSTAGESATELLLVGPRVMVGRSKGDVVFPNDRFVSRAHAAFVVSADHQQLHVIDLGSASGTLVDGRKIQKGVEVSFPNILVASSYDYGR